MNKFTQSQLSTVRKSHHFQLSDIAFLLDSDVGNLSRNESGKLIPTLKTILGYHIIFNTAIELLTNSEYQNLSDQIKDRCFILLEKLEHCVKTIKTELRMESLNNLITRLMPEETLYDEEEK